LRKCVKSRRGSISCSVRLMLQATLAHYTSLLTPRYGAYQSGYHAANNKQPECCTPAKLYITCNLTHDNLRQKCITQQIAKQTYESCRSTCRILWRIFVCRSPGHWPK
jgi:hypothetical protein